jgi:hypothetical protein
VKNISGQKQDATGGELSGGDLSRPGTPELCRKGMNSKHEKSSFVHITGAYKISAFTAPFFNL